MPGFSGKNSDLQGIAKRAQNTLTSHLLMPQGVLEIKSNPVQKDEKKGSIQGSHNNNNNNNSNNNNNNNNKNNNNNNSPQQARVQKLATLCVMTCP